MIEMDEHEILRSCGFDVVKFKGDEITKYNVSDNHINVILVINSMLYRRIIKVMKGVREDEQKRYVKSRKSRIEICGISIDTDEWDKKTAEEVVGDIENKLGLERR